LNGHKAKTLQVRTRKKTTSHRTPLRRFAGRASPFADPVAMPPSIRGSSRQEARLVTSISSTKCLPSDTTRPTDRRHHVDALGYGASRVRSRRWPIARKNRKGHDDTDNELVRVTRRPHESRKSEPGERTDDPFRIICGEMCTSSFFLARVKSRLPKPHRAGPQAMIAACAKGPLTFQAIIICAL